MTVGALAVEEELDGMIRLRPSEVGTPALEQTAKWGKVSPSGSSANRIHLKAWLVVISGEFAVPHFDL